MNEDTGIKKHISRSSDDASSLSKKLRTTESRLKWAEESRSLAIRILALLGRKPDSNDAITEILGMVKDFTGIEAVGIRLRDGNDFPYFETNGFPYHFVEAEKSLCSRNETGEILRDGSGYPIMECMCGNVLQGRTDPSLTFFTGGGSFWTNCTTDLLATSTEKERQSRTRNRCNGEGYESVALIPLRSSRETIGLLQLNDSRKNCFTIEMIEFFEGIGTSIGIVLDYKWLEQDRDRLFNLSLDMLCIAGFNGYFQQVNPAFTTTLGWTREEILSTPWIDFLHPEDREATLNSAVPLRSGLPVYDFENRYRCKDGSYRWISWNCFPVPSEDLIFAVGRDFTARKLTEQELKDSREQLEKRVEERSAELSMINASLIREINERKQAEDNLSRSEAMFSDLYENAPCAYFSIAPNGIIRLCNRRAEELVGSSRSALIGKSVFELYSNSPEGKEMAGRVFRRFLAGESAVDQELQMQRADGTLLWVSLTVSTMRDYRGRIIESRCMVLDITRRKETEKELELQKEKLKSILDHMNDGVSIVNSRFDIEYANPVLEADFGSVSGVKCHRFFYDRDRPCAKCAGQGLSTGRSIRRQWISEKTAKTYEVFNSPIQNADGTISRLAVFHDVSHRKRDEEEREKLQFQLLQAQKMEAIGTLSGGIAHDFNNLLQIVSGYTELLLQERTEQSDDYTDLQKICHAAKSGAELVHRLLTFSRKVDPKPVHLNLNQQIMHVEKLLKRTIPKMITIQLNLCMDLLEISADITQVEQILMNLCVNARDAMPDGGSLVIGTRNVILDETFSRIHPETAAGDYVLLTVTDTGHGMDETTVEHVFEPFYTTKELGRGTGLGLAMVYGIVKQHGGHITCRSRPGNGTTFEVFLPAIPSEAEPEIELSGEMPAFGTETVLLADDEAEIRELGERILTRHGYKVLTAVHGKEALEIYSRHKDVALVILDLMMPTMGGKECMEKILQRDPGAKILVASGFAEEAPSDGCIESGAKGFVSKPFKIKELLIQIRRTLDQV